jgi:hypothetical protein
MVIIKGVKGLPQINVFRSNGRVFAIGWTIIYMYWYALHHRTREVLISEVIEVRDPLRRVCLT